MRWRPRTRSTVPRHRRDQRATPDVIAAGGRPYEVATSLLDELRSARPSILVLEDRTGPTMRR
jgi:hypothetical protein